jgi:hypothetical protein
MPLLQWGAWTPDVADYEGTSAHSILNVVPRGDGYGPFPSFSQYSDTLPDACRGAFYALKSDGSVVTFAGTSTKLYQMLNTNYHWSDVSLGASSYSALTGTANWQFAQFGNLVFATQANAVLQVFDLSSSTRLRIAPVRLRRLLISASSGASLFSRACSPIRTAFSGPV